jgi:hypothetical protein
LGLLTNRDFESVTVNEITAAADDSRERSPLPGLSAATATAASASGYAAEVPEAWQHGEAVGAVREWLAEHGWLPTWRKWAKAAEGRLRTSGRAVGASDLDLLSTLDGKLLGDVFLSPATPPLSGHGARLRCRGGTRDRLPGPTRPDLGGQPLFQVIGILDQLPLAPEIDR